MAKSRTKKLEPGTYHVEVTIKRSFNVDPEDSYYDEDELLAECRRNGEMVDWEVERG